MDNYNSFVVGRLSGMTQRAQQISQVFMDPYVASPARSKSNRQKSIPELLGEFHKLEGVELTPNKDLQGFGNIRLPDLNVKPWAQIVGPISLRDSMRLSSNQKLSTYSLPEIETTVRSP
jgi:hypothetical protein